MRYSLRHINETEHMQITRHFRTTDFHAHVQSLKLWVLEIFAWLAGVINLRAGRIAVQEVQRELRRDLRELLFAMICARMTFHKRPSKLPTVHPYGAPSGFRFAARDVRLYNFFTRGIALKTLAQMRAVLDDIDAVVARAVKRVRKQKCVGALVAIAPPARVFAPCAPAPAPDAADTS